MLLVRGFREGDGSGGGPFGAPKLEDAVRHGGIGCPRCAWRPRRFDRWQCKCLHTWNTFDTRGICPSCLFAWKETQCLRCQEWSLHDEWYEKEERPR